ncbi:MAG: hypothetical protein CVT90_01790, partial [Candidatus Altiarchaeales archaeon HGW-Altiarchaeales-3]
MYDYIETTLVEKAGSGSASGKENNAVIVFKRNNKFVIENINKNIPVTYLLSGVESSGKTSILNYLFNIGRNKNKNCRFLDGSMINNPHRFFASLGGDIGSQENWKVAGEGILKKFGNGGFLFIDDFDKMLNDLGGDFAKIFKSCISQFKINILTTNTPGSLDSDKTLKNKKDPFHNFLNIIEIKYDISDIILLTDNLDRYIDHDDVRKIRELSNNNILVMELLIKNYSNNINKSIRKTIIENPILFERIKGELTSQQQAILKDLCSLVIMNGGRSGATIKDLAKFSWLSEAVVRTQMNRMVKSNFVKKTVDMKERGYLPNSLLFEMEKWELCNRYNASGISLVKLGEYFEAEKEYKKAIGINPGFEDAHYNLGILLDYLKRYDEAEGEYRNVLKINNNNEFTHNKLGILLAKLKKYKTAEKEFKTAINIDQNYEDAHYNIGILFYELKRYAEAEEEFKKVLDINPDNKDADENLIGLPDKLKRYKKEDEKTEIEGEVEKIEHLKEDVEEVRENLKEDVEEVRENLKEDVEEVRE